MTSNFVIDGYIRNIPMFNNEDLHGHFLLVFVGSILYRSVHPFKCPYYNITAFISSPGHRPCELLSWVSVRRPSVR